MTENEGLTHTREDSSDANPQATHVDKKSEKLTLIGKPLKIALAATLGLLSGRSSSVLSNEPVLYPSIPGIEPVPIVRTLEDDFRDSSHCYQIIDHKLVRQEFEIPSGSNRTRCFDRKDKTPVGDMVRLNYSIGPDYDGISAPDSLTEALLHEIRPLQEVMGKEHIINGIEIGAYHVKPNGPEYDFPIGGPPSIMGVADEERRIVELSLDDGVPISEQIMKIVAFHEGVHLMDGGRFDSDPVLTGMFVDMAERTRDNRAKFNAYRETLTSEDSDRFTQGDVQDDIMPSLGSLFTLVDESAYINDAKIGHPNSNPRELFASATTVLRYFPSSFMASVNKLDVADQQFMKRLAGYTVKFFNGPSHEIDHKRLQRLFTPELLEWLFGK